MKQGERERGSGWLAKPHRPAGSTERLGARALLSELFLPFVRPSCH